MEKYLQKTILILVLLFAAVISFTFLADVAKDPESHAATIEAIDNKIDTVLKLTGSSAVASAAISAIPGDTATPIANKLADFSQYFLLVLCVLYAEKYLLSIIGLAAFKILIPVACVIIIIGLFWKSETMNRIATKLLVFAVVVFLAIPVGVRLSLAIDSAYQSSVEQTLTNADSFSDLTASFPDEEGSGFWDSIWNRFSETAASLSDKASGILKNMVEALAVLIVSSCIIPVLTLLFFLWFFKLLTGIDIRIPNLDKKQRPTSERNNDVRNE